MRFLSLSFVCFSASFPLALLPRREFSQTRLSFQPKDNGDFQMIFNGTEMQNKAIKSREENTFYVCARVCVVYASRIR